MILLQILRILIFHLIYIMKIEKIIYFHFLEDLLGENHEQIYSEHTNQRRILQANKEAKGEREKKEKAKRSKLVFCIWDSVNGSGGVCLL